MYIYNSLSVHCTIPPNFCVCGAHRFTPAGGLSGASPGTTDGMDYRSMIVNIFGAEIM